MTEAGQLCIYHSPYRRQIYDRTGSLQDCEDMAADDMFSELTKYYRDLYKEVTEEDIMSFEVWHPCHEFAVAKHVPLKVKSAGPTQHIRTTATQDHLYILGA